MTSVLEEIHRLQGDIEKEETQRKGAYGISEFILMFTPKLQVFNFFL